MPLLTCPACGGVQKVAADAMGKTVPCRRCGHRFAASLDREADDQPDPKELFGGMAEDVEAARRRRAKTEEETPAKTLVQTVALIGGTVVALGLVFFVVTRFLGPKAPAPEPAVVAAEQQRAKAEQEKARAAEQERAQAEQEAARQREAVGRWRNGDAERDRDQADVAGRLVPAIAAFVGLCGYVFLIFFLGAVVARDANRRGMNGLGWAAFYFAFQAFFRTTVFVGFSMMPLILAPLGVVSLFLMEPFAWVGFFIYQFARRPGRLGRCDHCEGPMLEYLVRCPTCEAVLSRAAVRA